MLVATAVVVRLQPPAYVPNAAEILLAAAVGTAARDNIALFGISRREMLY